MRKDRISVSLTKELIKQLDEASRQARRSRSDYIELILESHLRTARSQERTAEIPFKLG